MTFTPDARTFYATLGTGGETLLVTGDVDARTVEVIEDNVECPSLSPDGRRVAFKHREGGLTGPITWRLWVLDLAGILRGRRTGRSRSRKRTGNRGAETQSRPLKRRFL